MKPRVLLVDDDAGVRYTLREILESAGLEVEEAADGADALARLEESAFQLVITDLRMPRIDGLELLKRARNRPQPPRVILITAHGSEKHAVEAMKAGAFGMSSNAAAQRPVRAASLLQVLRRCS